MPTDPFQVWEQFSDNFDCIGLNSNVTECDLASIILLLDPELPLLINMPNDITSSLSHTH